MAIELFGASVGSYAAIACIVSYLCSGHTGIYRAQRIGTIEHTTLEHHQGASIGAVETDIAQPPDRERL
jgi:hypothetical protein